MGSRTAKHVLPGHTGKTKNGIPILARSQRRPIRAALFLFTLCALVLIALLLPGAWLETSRREAYLPDLERQARLSPNDGPLLALLSGRLIEAGEYSAATDALKQALASGEQNEDLWLNLAAATAAGGATGRALADLRLGQARLPQSLGLQAARTRVAMLGSGAAPDKVARAICPDGPDPLVAAYTSGSIFNSPVEWWERRHPEQSGFATRQVWARQAPGDAQAARLWGLALLRNRRFTEAGDVLQRSVLLAPKSPAVHLALADWLDRTGEHGKASLQYLQCLSLRPDWLPALLGYGRSLTANGMTVRTGSCYQRATQIAPGSFEAWLGLARAYQATGASYDKSVAAYRIAAKLAPARTEFFGDFAAALQQTGHPDEAEAVLRRRLREEPGDSFAHYLLGTLLMNSNPTPERAAAAEAETSEAIRLYPNNPKALVQMAQLLLRRHQTRQAVDLLNKSVALLPYDSSTLRILSRAYQLAGLHAQSEAAARRADQLYHDQQLTEVLKDDEKTRFLNPTIHERLARLYQRTGQGDKAQQERAMVVLLRNDPQAAAQAQQSYEASLKAALGSR